MCAGVIQVANQRDVHIWGTSTYESREEVLYQRTGTYQLPDKRNICHECYGSSINDNMLLNAFDYIKETLRITDTLVFYGVEIKRNKAICPLHNEKSPSFTVYPNNNSWHCFGCKAGGSVIDFVMAYYGLDALEAAKKLDLDFNLGLFDNTPSQEELQKLSEKKELNQTYISLAKTFEAYMHKAYSILCEYLHLLENWKEMYAPKSPVEMRKSLNPLFIEACHQSAYIEYLVDYLMFADYEKEIQFYQTHRKEMVEIAAKVKHYSSRRNADEST